MSRALFSLVALAALGGGQEAAGETPSIEAAQISLAAKAILDQADLTQAITNKTLLYYDPGHGTQIEYYDAEGVAHLWYPGNKIIVLSAWSVGASEMGRREICFVFPSSVYNPVTKTAGGKRECQTAEDWAYSVQENADGDIFNLASDKPPWVLGKAERLTIENARQRMRAP